MKYDEEKCYWCGKHIGEGNTAYTSLRTDTLKTMRNFCREECLRLFKEYMKTQQGAKKPIRPYQGRNK